MNAVLSSPPGHMPVPRSRMIREARSRAGGGMGFELPALRPRVRAVVVTDVANSKLVSVRWTISRITAFHHESLVLRLVSGES